MKKNVIVMQGISGSGKSTIAAKLVEGVERSCIVSADSFFMRDGDYAFDRTKIGDAHADCFARFIAAMRHEYGTDEAIELIVVDNTNCSAVEIAPYMLGAAAYGYDARVLRVPCDVDTAAKRNVHGASRDTVLDMAVNLDLDLPAWWKVETHRAA